MRSILGYEEAVASPARRTQVRVTCTVPGGPSTDITEMVSAVTVTESCERTAPSATIEFGRRTLAYQDPLPGRPSSPLAAGNLLLVEMGEWGGEWVPLLQGEIISGESSGQNPAARATLEAIAGKQSWWRLPITSKEYIDAEVDAIVQDLFQTFGGLAPGDFDLPGISRVIAYLQVQERTLMDIAWDLYGPINRLPWWDPGALKLSTIDVTPPTAADLEIAPILRDSLDVGWQAPEATRVAFAGGSLRGIGRVEIGDWTRPANIGPEAVHIEGVCWTRGSKSDRISIIDGQIECYWALADGSDRQGAQVEWPGALYYLWICLGQEWAPDLGDPDSMRFVYRGPTGVVFLTNDPLVSDDAVSVLRVGGTLASYVTGWVMEEAFKGGGYGQQAWVKLRLDCQALDPGPTGYTALAYWQLLVQDGQKSLDFEIWGRQVQSDQLEELTAQAWDDDDIEAFGDLPKQEENAALYMSANPYEETEDEAARLALLARYSRYPATLALKGQDLRLQPGDAVRTPHPRDPCDVLLWARSIKHSWDTRGGKIMVPGWVVDTLEPA